MKDKAWPRILPFALFMAVIGLEEGLRFMDGKEWISVQDSIFALLYPFKPLVAVIALALCRRAYTELRWRDLTRKSQTLGSIVVGLVVFVLWINMDWTFGALSEPPGFNPEIFPNPDLTASNDCHPHRQRGAHRPGHGGNLLAILYPALCHQPRFLQSPPRNVHRNFICG
jgi:CAAX prenyl protease-like protein